MLSQKFSKRLVNEDSESWSKFSDTVNLMELYKLYIARVQLFRVLYSIIHTIFPSFQLWKKSSVVYRKESHW